jgi:p24 family protein alpha
MRPTSSVILLFLLGSATTNALHFYLDANQKRCFIEELPTDTVVEGTLLTATSVV